MGGSMGLSRRRWCCPRSRSLVGYLRSPVERCSSSLFPCSVNPEWGAFVLCHWRGCDLDCRGTWLSTVLWQAEQTFGWSCKGLRAHLHPLAACGRSLSGRRHWTKSFVPCCVFSCVSSALLVDGLVVRPACCAENVFARSLTLRCLRENSGARLRAFPT